MPAVRELCKIVQQKLTVLETAKYMITISDNTATKMLIEKLGGKQYLNQRFQAWGLEHTYIRNWLGDLKVLIKPFLPIWSNYQPYLPNIKFWAKAVALKH